MSEAEYIQCDGESIGMVRENRKCHPGGVPVILMKEEDARALVEEATRTEKHMPTRAGMMVKITQIVAPLAIGGSWLLGAAEGLADPWFAVISAGICVLWSAFSFRWEDLNA